MVKKTESIHLLTAGASFAMEGKREENFLSPDPKTLFAGAIDVKAQKQTQQTNKIFFIIKISFSICRLANITWQTLRY